MTGHNEYYNNALALVLIENAVVRSDTELLWALAGLPDVSAAYSWVSSEARRLLGVEGPN
jgi:hypothetical protein